MQQSPLNKALEAIFSLKGASLPHPASIPGAIRFKVASNAYLRTFSVIMYPVFIFFGAS
jgi:hypothetical protein